MRDELAVLSPRPTPEVRSAPLHPRNISVGDVVGKCFLTEALGGGGSCAVFRALHQALNLPVAVKLLRFDSGIAPQHAYELLRREARLLAQLNHPNVIRILDFEDNPQMPYLVLEIVEGPSLSELIQQSGRLSLERACQVMRQAVDGLAALWALGGVHRDVKPSNILLTRTGDVRIADLGAAILADEQPSPTDDELEAAAQEPVGTAAYLAPEQFLAPTTVDQRTDIYALGATFYEALTGRTPFDGRSRADLLVKHAREAPVPPHEWVPELGRRVSEVVLTMMAKDPDERYHDADDLREALSRLSEKERTAPQVRAVRQPDVVEEGSSAPEAASPPRRSFWKALLPDGRPRPAGQEDWLRLVKRTIHAPQQRKAAEGDGQKEPTAPQ